MPLLNDDVISNDFTLPMDSARIAGGASMAINNFDVLWWAEEGERKADADAAIVKQMVRKM